MSKHHARRTQAKKVSAATGAGYASAATGTAHHHKGPRLEPYDGTGFGEARTVEMTVAAALVGACTDGCAPCQVTGVNAMLAGDRLAVLGLAGPPFAALSALGPGAATSSALAPVVQQFMTVAAGPEAWPMIQGLTRLELAALIEQAANVWAAVGPGPDPSPGDGPEPAQEEELDEPVLVLERSCGYFACAGVSNLLSAAQIARVVQIAEARAAAGDPISCVVCDETIDVYTQAEVDIGLLREPGGDSALWTHPGCASSQLWSVQELEAARRRAAAASAGGDEDEAPARGVDWTMFTVVHIAGRIHPLIVIQPGKPHEHGLEGHLNEMRTHGLLPLELTGQTRLTTAEGWSVHTERGRLTDISRNGVPWYAQPGGHATTGAWRAAARANHTVLLIIAPYGTFTEGSEDLESLDRQLLAASAHGHLLGGLVTRYGSI